jgi:hypothetical protein
MRALLCHSDDDATPPVCRLGSNLLNCSARNWRQKCPSRALCSKMPLTRTLFSMQKFTILPIDISVETGDITPSLKLKRTELEAK